MNKKDPISQRDVEEYNSLSNDNKRKFDQILRDPSESRNFDIPDWSFNKEFIEHRLFIQEYKISLCKSIYLNGKEVSASDVYTMINFILYNIPNFKVYKSTNELVIFLDEKMGNKYEVRY